LVSIFAIPNIEKKSLQSLSKSLIESTKLLVLFKLLETKNPWRFLPASRNSGAFISNPAAKKKVMAISDRYAFEYHLKTIFRQLAIKLEENLTRKTLITRFLINVINVLLTVKPKFQTCNEKSLKMEGHLITINRDEYSNLYFK
jgi:hypothetical protein